MTFSSADTLHANAETLSNLFCHIISYLACSVHRNVQITIYTTKDAKCIKALTLGNNRRQKLETVNSVVSLASKENKQI